MVRPEEDGLHGLHRHHAIEGGVAGLVDGAHPSPRQEAQHLVPSELIGGRHRSLTRSRNVVPPSRNSTWSSISRAADPLVPDEGAAPATQVPQHDARPVALDGGVDRGDVRVEDLEVGTAAGKAQSQARPLQGDAIALAGPEATTTRGSRQPRVRVTIRVMT